MLIRKRGYGTIEAKVIGRYANRLPHSRPFSRNRSEPKKGWSRMR